ncbi:hypothetical protein SELMODRAFT_234795 [Selaginella moellendorffii]|uniref:NAD-dependent epimerase/dehydratase domain-containing protein n=1 Tax=Selaginella moellendorffii TaxID=88036 RepID=D8SQ30_SELML|nr:uncharacterized protein LOC9653033 [Selaginella moellendorffii]EFJ13516.1 hypothetical protein SELMODRAFT_234795 [Selaginella moellendorffii]|eukprot:XP_002985386.1 uncharacterized protein LOC9653033 [Selaginella moellendorffii]
MEEKKARVLVTGGSGFLGGALIRALLRSGRYEIRALVRRIGSVAADFDPELLSGGVEFVAGDVLDLESLVRACDGCQAVIHVAAYVKSWAPDPARFFQVNVGGLKNVIEAVKATASITKLVYTSSFFALGPSKYGEVADEQQVHSGKNFCTEYERSKLEADIVARNSEVPIVLLYPGVIYGSGRITRGNIIADILIERFNWRLPGYIGFGHDKFSFCHVEDVAAGHIAALERGAPGERFILGGPNKSLEDVFNISASLTGTRRPWFHIPLWLVYVYGYVSTVFARIAGVEPVVTHPAVSVIKQQWAYSSAKAERLLGYKPRSLEDGLAEMLVFLKDRQLITY